MLLCVRITLVLVVLFVLPGEVEIFEAPKAALLRICGAVALGMSLGSVAVLRRRRWQPLDFAVLAWLMVEVLATVFSDSPMLSVVGEPEQREGLLTSLALAGIYLAARLGTRNAVDARGVLNALLAGVAIASGYALLQALRIDPVPWRRTSALGSFMRPFGTLGNPNLLGILSAGALSMALARAALEPARRVLYAAEGLLFALATLVTVSRGAWAAAMTGSTLTVMLAWRAGARGALSRRSLIGIGVTVLAIIGFVASAGLSQVLRARFADLLVSATGSGASRVEIWRSALAAWHARPWLGHGPDTFGLVFEQFQTARYWVLEWAGLPVHSHSIYLHTLATRGVLGLGAGAASLLGATLALRSAWRAGGTTCAAAIALVGGMVTMLAAGAFGALGISGALALAGCAGTLAALAEGPVAGDPKAVAPPAAARARAPGARRGSGASKRDAKRSGHARWTRPRPRVWIPAATLGLAALIWSLADLGAWRETRDALTLNSLSESATVEVRRQALTGAASHCRKAVRWMPFEDALEIQRVESLLRLAVVSSAPFPVLAEAEQAAHRAIVLEPLHPFAHQRLGSTLLERARAGDSTAIAAAETCYAHSLALAPRNALSILELEGYMLALKRSARALELIRSAVALYPNDGFVQWRLAEALAANARIEEARAALDRSLAVDWQGGLSERPRADRLRQLLQRVKVAP